MSSTSIGAAPAAPTSDVRSWLSVVSVALSAAVFCSTEFLPVGLLRYISAGLHVTEGHAGLMVSLPGLMAALSAPLLTVAVGRWDRRRVLLALGALLAASNLIAMLAPSFSVLLIGRVLFGIGLGGFWAIGAGIGGRLVPAALVTRATALIFAGVSVGMLIGGAAGALIGDLFGWRVAFGVALVLSLLALAMQAASLPGLRVAQRIRVTDLLGIVSAPAGRIGLVAMAFALYGQFATYTYVTPFLAQVPGFSGTVISTLLLGYTLIGLLGNFLGGHGAGRDVKRTLAATILLMAAAVALLPVLGSEKPAAIALLTVWGIAYGAMPIALQTWMVKAAPQAQEGSMALFVANFQISIALGSLAGGVVVDRMGLSTTFYFGGVLGVLALVALARHRGRLG